MPGLDELFEELGYPAAQRRFRARVLSGLLGQEQILEQHGRGRAWLVVIVGRGSRHEAWNRAIRRECPALAGGGGHNIEERLMRQPELFSQGEAFGYGHDVDAEDEVVTDLGCLAGTDVTAFDRTLGGGSP